MVSCQGFYNCSDGQAWSHCTPCVEATASVGGDPAAFSFGGPFFLLYTVVSSVDEDMGTVISTLAGSEERLK